jgi:hypothetical protein
MMHRLAYRNYGTHESLASNMTVAATADPNGQTASRWYEIRSPGAASPTVYQQGTYAPDASYRWMASIAMDANQNVAMGYSKSSADTSPTIAYTGRLATDPLGIMQTETAVELPSMGSQTNPVRYAGRWGDYTAMQLDPIDDCTFWYINQYLPSDGLFNWRTRIVSFKFPSCQSEPGAPTSVAGTAGIASATVSWTRPVQVGTSPISGYTVTSEPSVATPTSCRNVAATSCVFTGLTPGVPYTFRVTATNAVGTGAASDPSPPVTPLPPPPLRRQVPVGGCVIVPRLIPRAGLRQLERPRCLTNAGQPVRVTVTGRLRGDLRYWKVIRKANGAVFIRTYGYRLRLIVTWSAPAVGDFTAYRLGRSYRT